MLKHEFEQLALRHDRTISAMLYDTIEMFYMSDSNYHREHGGIEESKQDFVKRVFGGKVNTPKTILKKITAEAILENRWCLRGNPEATKDKLDGMDFQIKKHYEWRATQA